MAEGVKGDVRWQVQTPFMFGKDHFEVCASDPGSGDGQFAEEIGAGISEFLNDPFFQQFAVDGNDTGAG